MNEYKAIEYHDKYLGQSNGGTSCSFQDWLITKLGYAEKNIYDLLARCKELELERNVLADRLNNVAQCANEFNNAIRTNNNKVAHYRMLELDSFLEEYGYRTRIGRD